MNVDDIVAEQIAAARAKIAAAKRRREELSAARRRGLAARHAAKLRYQASRVDIDTTQPTSVAQQATDQPTEETP